MHLPPELYQFNCSKNHHSRKNAALYVRFGHSSLVRSEQAGLRSSVSTHARCPAICKSACLFYPAYFTQSGRAHDRVASALSRGSRDDAESKPIEAHQCRCLPGSAYSASQIQRRPSILQGGLNGQIVCALQLPLGSEELWVQQCRDSARPREELAVELTRTNSA